MAQIDFFSNRPTSPRICHQPNNMQKNIEKVSYISDKIRAESSLEDIDYLKSMISSDPEFINRQDDRMGSTPLLYSIISNLFKTTQFLLSSGANPNIPNNLAETPLHYASDNFQFEIAKLLLTHAANPKLANVEGETSLHNATYRGDTKIVNLLLMYHADPNAKNFNNGQTPLHISALNGHLECVRLLLTYGADPTIEDNEGNTPLNLSYDKIIIQILND